MLVEGFEGTNEGARILKDYAHPVIDVLEHLIILADRHFCSFVKVGLKAKNCPFFIYYFHFITMYMILINRNILLFALKFNFLLQSINFNIIFE